MAEIPLNRRKSSKNQTKPNHMSKEICRLEEGHNLFPLEYRLLVQREIAKNMTNCSNFEESMRFGTQVVLTSTKRFSYSAKLILLFNGYF